jgi:acyl-coenzyme A thioesterase PaaI-like protein
MTMMDIALSGAVCFALGKYTSTPTVSSSFDFMAGAKEGDWIYGDIHSVKLTRTMGFASATIEGPNGSVARASACFKLPRDIESAPGMGIKEYHQWRTSI